MPVQLVIVVKGLEKGALRGVEFEGDISNVGDSPNEALVINDLFIPASLTSQQGEHVLVVQLLKSEQLIEVLHLIADAQLIITVFNVSEHQIHQLPEHFLRGCSFREAVPDESHHDVKSELIFDLHADCLGLDLEDDDLLAIFLENNPPCCDNWDKEYEVDDIEVGAI